MIPEVVRAVCASFLELAPPGLVTGLYLCGGTGFGEWVAGQSDIDFVATLSHRPDRDEIAALRAVHEQLAVRHPEQDFDGMHLLVDDLARDPAEVPDVPTVLHRYFEAEGHHDSEVIWHELAWHGVMIAGPPISELDIWTDQQRLLEFTRGNLDTYWRSTAEALAAMPSEGAVESWCSWCVLGVARLHHLLVTGEMTAKSAAGRWGLTYYPERFHRVLREALRVRDGSPDEYADDREARGRDTAEFTAFVVHEGTKSPG